MTSDVSPTARRAGLTKQIIADKAVLLSEEYGLTGWSIRDLAGSLDVVPSVIYHYFPNKEDLYDAVVDQVCAEISLPDENLEWKPWFRALLKNVRPVLLRYNGITDRLTVGKLTKQFLPIVDTACEKLLAAGFAEFTPLAYSMIFNAAIWTIGARNLRWQRRGKPVYSLTEMLDRMRPMADESAGLEYLINNLFEPLTQQQTYEQISEEYYDLIIQVLLDGVEHILLPKAQNKE